MNELDAVAKELQLLAKAIRKTADNLKAFMNIEAPPGQTEKQPSQDAGKQISLEQVRAVLASKSQDGFTQEVRDLLIKYGAPRLSEINPSNYGALLADAEGLK